MIREPQDIEEIDDDEFPLLMESHLEGQEFSCEAFIHNGKVKFLNITEYVRLGHYQLCTSFPFIRRMETEN